MPFYNDARAFAPVLRETMESEAAPSQTRTTWRDAWLMIREAVRPYPEMAKAVLAVVDRLIAECDACPA